MLAQEVYHDGIGFILARRSGNNMVTVTRPDLAAAEMPTPGDIADIVIFLRAITGATLLLTKSMYAGQAVLGNNQI